MKDLHVGNPVTQCLHAGKSPIDYPCYSLTAIRELAVDLGIHGTTSVPSGSMITMDSYSKGTDLAFLDKRDDVRPERWLTDVVEARKDTPVAQMDYPGHFSRGVRRCLGSRVSKNEVFILLAQLVLDWKMSSPIKYWKDIP
jgi:cytochrome P450